MARLQVERLGGLAGLGGPLSRIRSRGEIDCQSLSAADRKAVDKLFESHARPKSTRSKPKTLGRDTFTYRLTRVTSDGQETIEVPESLLPESLYGCLRDELV